MRLARLLKLDTFFTFFYYELLVIGNSLGFPRFQGASLTNFIVCYHAAAAVMVTTYVPYSWVGQVILVPAESAMLWVNCYLPINIIKLL